MQYHIYYLYNIKFLFEICFNSVLKAFLASRANSSAFQ